MIKDSELSATNEIVAGSVQGSSKEKNAHGSAESFETIKKISRDFLASFNGEIFLFVFSFLLGVLTARFLGAEGKGQFNVVYNAIGLLTTIFSFRFQKAFSYYLSKSKDMLGEVLIYASLIGVFSTTCVVILSIVFHDFFYDTLFKGINTVPWFILVLVCTSAYLWNLLLNLLAGLQLFKKRSVFMGGSYILKSALVVLAIGYLKGNLFDLFLIMGSIETIAYLLFIIFFFPKAKSYRFNLDTFSSMFKYSAASFPGLLSDKVTLGIDVFFLNYFSGASQVGVYSVAISVSNMLLYIPKAIGAVIMPFVASNNEERKITPQISRLLITTMFVIMMLMAPVIWVAVPLVFGEEFAFSRVLFLLLAPGTIFWGVYTLFSSDIEGRGLPGKASFVSMISAVATIILDLLLIPVLGNAGASIVSTITYALSMILIIYLYKRISKVHMRDVLFPKREDFVLLLQIWKRLTLQFKKS